MTQPTSDGDDPDDPDDDLEDPVLRMVASGPSISLGSAFMVALRGVLSAGSPWTVRAPHAGVDGSTSRGLADDLDESDGEARDGIRPSKPRPCGMRADRWCAR